MRAHLLFPLIVTTLSVLSLRSEATLGLNGWYPCGTTFGDHATPPGNVTLGGPDFNFGQVASAFECAQGSLPLCYDGACESDQYIDVFFKRLPQNKSSVSASGTDEDTPSQALWIVNGGPGLSSASLEELMAATYADLNGEVAVYAMDQRGTGRSHVLQCEAAQSLADGGPQAATVTEEEMVDCLRDLKFQYEDNAVAFSATSAAMDLKTVIEIFHHDAGVDDVYVYGLGFGSFVLQRLVQLHAPSSVRGFIFDGVDVLTTKCDPFESAYSHGNFARLGPSRRLLEYCADDPTCPLKFESKETIEDELFALLEELDADRSNNCSSLLHSLNIYKNPSDSLRAELSWRVSDLVEREYVPLLLAKIKSCTPEDFDDLLTVLDPDGEVLSRDGSFNEDERRKRRHLRSARNHQKARLAKDGYVHPAEQINPLLFNLIVASERWAQPWPTVDELTDYYLTSPFSVVNSAVAELDDSFEGSTLLGSAPTDEHLIHDVCMFQQSHAAVCKAIDRPPLKSPAFVYERDQFYYAPLSLGASASALILNGALDFVTPTEFGELLLDKLEVGDGGKKASVTFDYGGHGTGEATAASRSMRCHDSIITQFVRHEGDIDQIDMSCVKTLPKIAFHTTFEGYATP